MIKVNLKSTGKVNAGGGSEFVADLDLSGLNLRMLILCAAVGYAPGFIYFDDIWTEEAVILETQMNQLKVTEKKLQTELKSMASYEKQLEDLQSKEKTIKQRIDVVNQVTDKRNNPMKIMLYIAENIPEDVWVKEIKIEKTTFFLKGHALTYKSIGDFMGHLKDSIFFGQNVNLDDYSSIDVNGARIQEFILRAGVYKFE